MELKYSTPPSPELSHKSFLQRREEGWWLRPWSCGQGVQRSHGEEVTPRCSRRCQTACEGHKAQGRQRQRRHRMQGRCYREGPTLGILRSHQTDRQECFCGQGPHVCCCCLPCISSALHLLCLVFHTLCMYTTFPIRASMGVSILELISRQSSYAPSFLTKAAASDPVERMKLVVTNYIAGQQRCCIHTQNQSDFCCIVCLLRSVIQASTAPQASGSH